MLRDSRPSRLRTVLAQPLRLALRRRRTVRGCASNSLWLKQRAGAHRRRRLGARSSHGSSSWQRRLKNSYVYAIQLYYE